MTPADGLGSRPAASRACSSNSKIDLLKQAVVSPIVEVALYGRERRKVVRQHPPLTAGPPDIQDRVQHRSQPGLARPAQRLDRRHRGLDQRPLRIGDIACVPLSPSLILLPSDFGSTYCASMIA